MMHRRRRPFVPILMYHHVSPQPIPAFRKYTVTPRRFEQQIAWLTRAGYTGISLDALYEARANGAPLPPRPVVLTFDDGFQGVMDHAIPILQRYGFTAVFFFVAGLMGETSRWLLEERGVDLPLMDWSTARALVAAGFTCGSHTLTHPHLSRLSPETCWDELRESRHLLEKHLDSEVRHLAYPFGDCDDRVCGMAGEAGYDTASSVVQGLSGPDDNRLALHRVPVNGQDTTLDFIARLCTGRSPSESLHRRTRHALARLTMNRG